MTLEAAIGAAGLFLRNADLDAILVVRPTGDGGTLTYVLSWNRVWHRNTQLAPGDFVMVADRSLAPL